MSECTVIGIGAMGGGMARALLESPSISLVSGFDLNREAVEDFFGDATEFGKAGPTAPDSLRDAIGSSTDFVVLSLVNEAQCEKVCFGGGDDLLTLVPRGACVILTSTVTAAWAIKANARFQKADILFVDCPVSGGPVRAEKGDLTLMASGNVLTLETAKPVLDALAREVHVIEGGAGSGSTVKCIHQLLAGVHICAAAEAMAMAAKAGLDVQQFYEIVNGAAGASWMFTDRVERMLEEDPDVKSALNIFVKDMGIVHAEAKRLQCPIPVAAAALQQYISGQSLDLGTSDDSQVVQVYEAITKVKVAASSESLEDSLVVLNNEFVKATKSKGGSVEAGTYNAHALGVTIGLPKGNVVELEFLKPPPMRQDEPLETEKHAFCLSWTQCRIYKLSLAPGENATTTYPFFHISIPVTDGDIATGLASELASDGTHLQWKQHVFAGDVKWSEPRGDFIIFNKGRSIFHQYIIELI